MFIPEGLVSSTYTNHFTGPRFSLSLRAKRRKRYEYNYPCLFQKMDPVIVSRLFDRYYHLYPARPEQDATEALIQFGNFFHESLLGIDDVPPYFLDLVRFEQIKLKTRLSARPEDTFDQINAFLNPKTTHEISLISVPQHAQGVMSATFNYDVTALYERFSNDEPLEPVSQKKSYIVFQQVTNKLKCKTYEINDSTYLVLSLIDGKRNVADIAKSVCSQLKLTGLDNEIIQVVNFLTEKQLVNVYQGGPHV